MISQDNVVVFLHDLYMILAVQSWALSKITVVNNLSHTTNYCDFYHGTSVSLQPQQTLTKSKASCDCVSDNELQSTNQNTRTWALTLIKCISCEAHPHCRYVKIWHNYTEKGTDSCSDICTLPSHPNGLTFLFPEQGVH